jgi:hypothetical protein
VGADYEALVSEGAVTVAVGEDAIVGVFVLQPQRVPPSLVYSSESEYPAWPLPKIDETSNFSRTQPCQTWPSRCANTTEQRAFWAREEVPRYGGRAIS